MTVPPTGSSRPSRKAGLESIRPSLSTRRRSAVAGGWECLALTRGRLRRYVCIGPGLLAIACAAGPRAPGAPTPVTPISTGAPSNGNFGTSTVEPTTPDDAEQAGPEVQETPAPAIRETSGTVTCSSPRPRLCEDLSSPVCAKRRAKTCDSPTCEDAVNVPNGCLACSDPRVISYTEGHCAESTRKISTGTSR
jgi:hypothetical protein